MKRIFALGGGELRYLETFKIDKEIVKASEKENPKALLIPTAIGEPIEYTNTFNLVYGEKLGCKTKTLLLLDGNTSQEDAEKEILSSDIIYVGGGNTRKMIEVWKKYSIDSVLQDAYEKGIILSGLSAGSICWFESGHSNSDSYETEEDWSFSRVKGLNFIDAIHCPHFNENGREENFNKLIFKNNKVGIAIDNNCAIDFKGNDYRIIKGDENSKAYRIINRFNEIVKEELTNISEYKPISELLKT